MVQQEAVVVRNAMKRYGKEQLVLNDLNMTVSRGSIYGLLGASGCGKSTLLSCIVGIHYFNSGKVWVLGEIPGSKGSGIPGPRVGYMPQDISLAGEFTISDAFYYFGRINGLKDEEIGTKQTFFSEFLQLPPLDHLVKNMSGGEQRRVSFACALIHTPELLILDEPTVGLDSVLRDNIWTYMEKLTQKEGVTVLITTHYIEEAKKATKIGLMRKGKLLAELKPCELLQQFQCSLLEEAFLKLSETQDEEITSNEKYQRLSEGTSSNVLSQDRYEPTKEISETKAISGSQVLRLKRLKALTIKNHIQFIRDYIGLLFKIFFLLQTNLFLVSVGGDLKDIKIGIINEEARNCNFGINIGNVWKDESICNFGNLSCRFLHHFDDSIAIKEYYHDFSEAERDVQNGKLCGIMYFSQNFSESMQKRVENYLYTKDSDLNASEIQVFLDMSDSQTGLFMQRKLSKRFIEIFEDIMRDCNYSIKLAHLPIKFEDPIHGKTDYNYKDFTTPSAILTFIFFLAVTNSTNLILADRSKGLWNRSIIQGVRTEEILLSHIFYQSLIGLIDTIVLMLTFFVLWGTDYKGSIFVIFFVVFLSGFCGLMYGFTISVFCKNHTMAHYSSAGSFLLLLLISGAIWPLEGSSKYIRWFIYVMPITLPSISMRGLIYKGSFIFEWEVLIGIFMSLIWISFFLLATILYLRRKIL